MRFGDEEDLAKENMKSLVTLMGPQWSSRGQGWSGMGENGKKVIGDLQWGLPC